MSSRHEEVWRVVNADGEDASGYNNVAGLYLTENGAKKGKGYAERIDRRRTGYGHKSRGPFTIQHGVIQWEEEE